MGPCRPSPRAARALLADAAPALLLDRPPLSVPTRARRWAGFWPHARGCSSSGAVSRGSGPPSRRRRTTPRATSSSIEAWPPLLRRRQRPQRRLRRPEPDARAGAGTRLLARRDRVRSSGSLAENFKARIGEPWGGPRHRRRLPPARRAHPRPHRAPGGDGPRRVRAAPCPRLRLSSCSTTRGRAGPRRLAALPCSGCSTPRVGLVDPARLVWGLARAAESARGGPIHEHTRGHRLRHSRVTACVVTHRRWQHPRATGSSIGTNASRRACSSASAPVVLPVYDHVLMTEPLTPAQLDAIGWKGREGLTDAGNQFHYYRRTLDDRVLFGGYDANYHFPGRIDPRAGAVGFPPPPRATLPRHLPAARGRPVHAPLGGRHRHDLALHARVRHRPRRRLADAVGYTGLGVASTRFGARVALDLVAGRDTGHPPQMVRRKPFPSRPSRSGTPRCGRRGPALPPRTAPAAATSGCAASTPWASASTAEAPSTHGLRGGGSTWAGFGCPGVGGRQRWEPARTHRRCCCSSLAPG